MAIQTIGIIGAGIMGNGIAQVCAVAGFQTVMQDVADAALERGMKTINGSLERIVRKGGMTEARAFLENLKVREAGREEESGVACRCRDAACVPPTVGGQRPPGCLFVKKKSAQTSSNTINSCKTSP